MTESSTSVEIRMLGRFELRVEGREIAFEDWRSKKALTLLMFLAAQAGGKVASDVLVDTLWPERDLESASSSLYTTVYNVRRMLEGKRSRGDTSRIRSSNGFYWLELEDQDFLDVHEFLSHSGESRRLGWEHPQEALDHGLAAIDVYRGDFLKEFGLEDWAVSLRETYREVYLETVLRTAELLADTRRDYGRSVRLLREAIALEPLREELYRQAIQYLTAAGCGGEAAQLYEQLSELLAKEFGIGPSRETQRLLHESRQETGTGRSPGRRDRGEKDNAGAYVCSGQVFEAMVRVETRRLNREKRPFALLSFWLADAEDTAPILEALRYVLREGDLLCTWQEGRIMGMLPAMNEAGMGSLIPRIRHSLDGSANGQVSISYQVVEPELWQAGMDPLQMFMR